MITFEGASGGAKTAQKNRAHKRDHLEHSQGGRRNEQITLDYQAIEVTWVNGGKTAMDDWSSSELGPAHTTGAN